MPSTQFITETILSGDGIMRHTDGNYYFDKPLYAHIGIPDEYVPRVVIFLKGLKSEIDSYYLHQQGHSTNYEDLYYVASQIEDSESGNYDNPTIKPLIDKILPEIQPLFQGTENGSIHEWQLHTLAMEATHYIHDVVWHLLDKEPSRTNHLDCLIDACKDDQMSHVDIFTLNHDTVIEQCLSHNGIQVNDKVTDGFGEPLNNVRHWEPDLFENESFNVRLFKLHGSLNWFRHRPDGGDWRNEFVGIFLDKNFCPTETIDRRPMLLAGTFNKMFQYTRGIYADLYCHFYRSLPHFQRLVVSGYSFGDKGINTRIAEWIYSAPDRRILLIDPEPEKLKLSARGAISNKWDEWIDQRKLTILKKGIEDTLWNEIRDILI